MSTRAMTVLIVFVLFVAGVGWLVYRHLAQPDVVVVEAVPEAPAAKKRKPRLRVIVTHCARVFGRTEMAGYVENIGNVPVSFVKVQPIWKDMADKVVDTGTVFAVRDDPLAPGERAAFEDFSARENALRCNARLDDYWS